MPQEQQNGVWKPKRFPKVREAHRIPESLTALEAINEDGAFLRRPPEVDAADPEALDFGIYSRRPPRWWPKVDGES
jgi:hypothetical protein